MTGSESAPAVRRFREIFQKQDFPRRITACFLAVMCSFYLLYADKSGYLNIVQAKRNIFYMVTGGYLVLMAACGGITCVFRKKLPPLKQMLQKSTWCQRLLCGYLLCTAISTLLSKHPMESLFGMKRLDGLFTIGLSVLCFLLVSVFGQARQWLVYLLGGTMTFFCLLCLLQMQGENPFQLYPAGLNYFDKGIKYSGAYLGTIGNTDLVAALLCVAVPVFIVFLLRMRGRRRFLLLLPLTLSLCVLVQMDVRAGWVGICGGCMLMLPVVLPIHQRARKVLVACIAGLCVTMAAVLWLYDFGGTGTLYEAHMLLRGHAQDSHGTGRIYIWKKTFEIVPEALLFGGGPDTLSLRLNAVFHRYDPALNLNIVGVVDVAHNEYLNILANQGLLALAAYLGALGTSLVKWVRSSGRNPAVAMGGAAMLCYSMQAFFGISMLLTAPYFWLAWALLEQAQ